MTVQPKCAIRRLYTMRNLLTAFALLLLHTSASAQIPLIKAGQIDAWRKAKTDSVLVINFWATWCVPCIEELPDIMRLNAAYADRKVKLVLVSNDFKKNLQTKVVPFVREHAIEPYTVFMDEPTPNKWIDTVNPDWSGGIPSTWMLNPAGGKEAFHEGKMSYEQLEQMLLSVLEN